MAQEMHYQSTEQFYLPIMNKDPIAGFTDSTAITAYIALPAVGAAPSVWVAATWKTGTMRKGDDRYNLLILDPTAFTIAAGTTYQPWVRMGGAGSAIVKIPDTIKAINT